MIDGVCLVTGGAGFIGSSLSHGLVERFSRVVALDNLHPQVHATRERPPALHLEAELIVGDVCDPEIWDKVLEAYAPKVIIHLAAETGTGQSLTEASRHARVNVTGTTQMLDACVRNGRFPGRIILSSSRAVYGEGAWRYRDGGKIYYPGQRSKPQLDRGQWDFANSDPVPMSSKFEPRPSNIYAATKLAQEHIINSWSTSFAVDAIIMRLQNVYGPGQSLRNAYTGIVSLFARQAAKGDIIEVYEDGLISRDFVYIDDVKDAFIAALDLEKHNITANLPIDIGSGSKTELRHLAQLVANFYGAPTPKVVGKFRHGDVRHAVCTIDQAKSILNWAPNWDLETGVHSLCRWIEGSVGQQ